MRVYRQPTANSPRRRIALGTVAATAGIAFVIAVITLTAGDLVSGGSIGKGGGRTTLLGGHRKNQQEQKQDATPEQDDARSNRHHHRPGADHGHGAGRAAAVGHRAGHAAIGPDPDRARARSGRCPDASRPGGDRSRRGIYPQVAAPNEHAAPYPVAAHHHGHVHTDDARRLTRRAGADPRPDGRGDRGRHPRRLARAALGRGPHAHGRRRDRAGAVRRPARAAPGRRWLHVRVPARGDPLGAAERRHAGGAGGGDRGRGRSSRLIDPPEVDGRRRARGGARRASR